MITSCRWANSLSNAHSIDLSQIFAACGLLFVSNPATTSALHILTTLDYVSFQSLSFCLSIYGHVFSCSIVWLVAGWFFFHSNKWKHLVAYVKRTSWIHNICSPSKYILKQKIKKIWCWFDKLDFSEMMPFTHPTSHSCKTFDSYYVRYLYFVCQIDERVFKM